MAFYSILISSDCEWGVGWLCSSILNRARCSGSFWIQCDPEQREEISSCPHPVKGCFQDSGLEANDRTGWMKFEVSPGVGVTRNSTEFRSIQEKKITPLMGKAWFIFMLIKWTGFVCLSQVTFQHLGERETGLNKSWNALFNMKEIVPCHTLLILSINVCWGINFQLNAGVLDWT